MRPGTILAERYTLGEELGSGTIGGVWLGHDTVLDRPVTIKILHRRLAVDESTRARFRRVALEVASLSVPGIVDVYDCFEEPDPDGGVIVCHVTERVAGRPLRQILDERHTLTVDETLPLITTAARALDRAHDANVVHGNLKPENLIVGPDDTITVVDFGFLPLDDATRPRPYAPERGTTGASADVYSLAAIAYESLTGQLPDADPQPLPESIDPAFAAAILRALSHQPKRRFSTATAFADACLPAPPATDEPSAASSAPPRSVTTANPSTEPATPPDPQHPTETTTASDPGHSAEPASPSDPTETTTASEPNQPTTTTASDPGHPVTAAVPGQSSDESAGAPRPDEPEAAVAATAPTDEAQLETTPAGVASPAAAADDAASPQSTETAEPDADTGETDAPDETAAAPGVEAASDGDAGAPDPGSADDTAAPDAGADDAKEVGPPRKRGSSRVRIVAVLLALLIVSALVMHLVRPSKPTSHDAGDDPAPDTTGTSTSASPSSSPSDVDVPPNSADPAPTTSKPPPTGTTSSDDDSVTVPGVVGKQREFAAAELYGAGFEVEVAGFGDGRHECPVEDQDPDAGASASAGSTVTISVRRVHSPQQCPG